MELTLLNCSEELRNSDACVMIPRVTGEKWLVLMEPWNPGEPMQLARSGQGEVFHLPLHIADTTQLDATMGEAVDRQSPPQVAAKLLMFGMAAMTVAQAGLVGTDNILRIVLTTGCKPAEGGFYFYYGLAILVRKF